MSCSLAMLLLFGGTCQAAGPAFQEGIWEMTMETSMEGLPFAVPPTVVKSRQCVTKKDMVPKDNNAKNCTFSKMKKSGNKVSWAFECDQDGSRVNGTGEMTYSGTSSSGTSKMVMLSEGRKMTASSRLQGKRVGPCDGSGDSMEVNGQDVKEMEAQVNSAKAAKKRLDDSAAATRKQSLDLIGRLKIPKYDPSGCDHAAANEPDSINAACEDRLGELDIREGEWEVTTEMTRKAILPMGDEKMITYEPVVSETKKVCLSPYMEPLQGLEMKRSGNRITWKDNNSPLAGGGFRQDRQGGIEYRGTSFEGGTIEHSSSVAAENFTYTRISGKRIGDGECIGRDGTARKLRQRSREARQHPESAGGSQSLGDSIIDNPAARKLKSFFGF